MSLRSDWHTVREGFRAQPLLSPAVTMGLVAFVTCSMLLQKSARWPGACDHSGRRLIGYFAQLRCSPDLLNGDWKAWALFACLWAMPAVAVGTLIYAFVKKRGIFKKT